MNVLTLILGILVLEFLAERWISYLNYTTIGTKAPTALADLYNAEEYSRSMHYQKQSARLGILSAVVSFGIMLLVVLNGYLGTLNLWIDQYIQHPIANTLVFFACIMLLSELIQWPFQWYDTFVIEERFGFNKSTKSTFVLDKVKGLLLTAVLGGLLIGILLWLIIVLGAYFWIWSWIVITGFILLANLFYTSWILPIFNKLSPLPDGELHQAIIEYAQKVDFPLDQVLIMDGSKRSSKANAFFSGLGSKKKIVLYDTLVQDFSTEEVVAVLAHETGHYKEKHIVRSLVWSILQTGVILFVLSKLIFLEPLSLAMGYSGGVSIGINLIAFGIILSPLSTLLGILMNLLSRKHEYEADAYAAKTYNGASLVSALKKLSVSTLSNLNPHKYYVFLYYSHPPLLHRLQALQALEI